MDAAEALRILKEGNERFVKNQRHLRDWTQEERQAMALEQKPLALVVACADSRVSPEILFNQPMGSLFVVRVAGHALDDFALASVEFGVHVLGISLVLILGHENCGALQAAMAYTGKAPSPQLDALMRELIPAVEKAKKKTQDAVLECATQENTVHVQKKLRANALTKDVSCVRGIFHISTGAVEWLSDE